MTFSNHTHNFSSNTKSGSEALVNEPLNSPEQEDLLCTLLTQHLLNNDHRNVPDITPLWYEV